MNKKARQSNIELLRIFTMLGVIILHYNNPSIGGGLKYVETGSINYYLLNVLESIFVCAVDLFMLISGYFMVYSTKRNMWKPIQLFVQVSIFSAAKYIIVQGIINNSFKLPGLFRSVIPTNYFVILYVVVFVVSPYINLLFEQLNDEQMLRFISLLIFVFSIWPTTVDVLRELTKTELLGLSSIGMYGSQYGYSAVNFILCYCVGAFIKKSEDKLRAIKVRTLLFIISAAVAVLTAWAVINDKVGFFSEKSAWEYCNPLVILLAVCFFLLFKRIVIGYNKVINSLAKSSFTVYLLHINLVTHIGINQFVNCDVWILMVHMICSAIFIYVLCWGIYLVYSRIEEYVFSKLKKAIRLPSIDI